jgi:hypothetical protein
MHIAQPIDVDVCPFVQHPAMTVDCRDVNHAGQTQMTIDTLPDDALLYVFDFYVAQAPKVEAWHTLGHVCRRWRILLFGSPRRLNLQIACTNGTRVKEKLGVWQDLPIVISRSCGSPTDLDNIKAALEHHARVCKIKLLPVVCHLEDIVSSLQKPFPMLTDLELSGIGCFLSFDPDPSKFLGGSARLRLLALSGLWIPDLPNFLLSTPNLVILCLDNIRNSEGIVTCLSALTRLEQLKLEVEFGQLHHERANRRLPPLTRAVLPSLTQLRVKGHTESLDDFVARIDAPLLDHLYILYAYSAFDGVIVLHTPHVHGLIGRIPRLQAPDEAYIGFDADNYKMWINFFSSKGISRSALRLEILCFKPERQFSCMAWFCRSPPFSFHSLEFLCIGESQFSEKGQKNHTENTRWLELLQPFVAVKRLFLAKEFALHITHALQELVGERVKEVLPTLEMVVIDELQLSGPVYEAIKKFAAARRLAGHPVAISRWKRKKRRARH